MILIKVTDLGHVELFVIDLSASHGGHDVVEFRGLEAWQIAYLAGGEASQAEVEVLQLLAGSVLDVLVLEHQLPQLANHNLRGEK